MSWSAANAPKARQNRLLRAGDDSESPHTESPRRDDKRRSGETVEAALSRLSKAYTTSMECIGALHKTDRMLQKDPSKVTDESLQVLVRVSNAARSTLENGVLLDPLILPHVSTLQGVILSFTKRSDEMDAGRWSSSLEPRPAPPILSSAAHKSKCRELAYLALVNYADLLQSCSFLKRNRDKEKQLVLDRGVVKAVKTLETNNRSCWNEERQEDTIRLAVTALCDASKLDDTDPIMWLKLACAARTLEHITEIEKRPFAGRSKHRRLQRYALERGSTTLPPHLPPNRAVTLALAQLASEATTEEHEFISEPDEDATTLVLELPRYSWSVLGRMLLRACREGADYHRHHHYHSSRESQPSRESIQFGSPSIVMKLSPMLALPKRVLGNISRFLDNGSIWRFEATCRALSVAIISARAEIEEEIPTNQRKPGSGINSDVTMDDAGKRATGEDTIKSDRKTEKAAKNKKEDSGSSKSRREHHRSSQRLRSQQITSGRRAERNAKRQSFEYCFFAATRGMTIEKHRKQVAEIVKEDIGARHLFPLSEASQAPRTKRALSWGGSTFEATERRRDAEERTGDASLSAFIKRWSGKNSGPIKLMTSYLAHVAMNTEDVFASDPGGTVVLTSCLLACFEVERRRAGSDCQLVRRMYSPFKETNDFSKSLEGFAIDLLHAELILKQCDRYDPVLVEFDDDPNLITLLISEVIEACEDLQGALSLGKVAKSTTKIFQRLKIRCYWLQAGFYLWRSRTSKIIWEAREAEEEGIAAIEEAMNGFESPALVDSHSIFTPHLVSPGRTEPYWKELNCASLKKYRDEIQASSVVSLVREKFQDLISTIGDLDGDTESISKDDSSSLADIGSTLFRRYESEYKDPNSKLSELVEDFLSLHGDELGMERLEDENEDINLSRLSRVLPVGGVGLQSLSKLENPSILSMLLICAGVHAENRYKVVLLLSNLLLATKDMHESLLRRISDADQSKIENDENGFSDSDEDSTMTDDQSNGKHFSSTSLDEKRARRCGHFMELLVERLTEGFSRLDVSEQEQFMSSNTLVAVITEAVHFSSRWFETTAKRILPEDTADQAILSSVRSLVEKIQDTAPATNRKSIEKLYFGCLTRAFIIQRHVIEELIRNHGNRSTRIARQKLCIKRTEYVGLLSNEIGTLLSKNRCRVQKLQLLQSHLIFDVSLPTGAAETASQAEMNLFLDSANFLWKYSSQPLSESQNPAVIACSAFDRPIVKALRIPLATLVVGLCGSATFSRNLEDKSLTAKYENDPLCLAELFDSDASANECFSDSEDTPDSENYKRKELLRAICHAVHCINIVLEKVDDNGALSVTSDRPHQCGLGPLLPLVGSRVLNSFSDTLLGYFIDENQSAPNLWSEEYPFCTRAIGTLLDLNLHKCYRWLYGFVLVGEKNIHQSTNKDMAASVLPISDVEIGDCRLENISVAAQLYRCIVRAYAGGRRSPPKAALELVSSALPPLAESAKSAALRRFIFDAEGHHFSLEELRSLVKRDEGWDASFCDIRKYIVHQEDTTMQSFCESGEDEEVLRVRRGILSELADGPLPVAQDSKNKSDATVDDDRMSTIKIEEEISKKFEAILDDLCLGEAHNSEGWYRAAQCMTTKAELIADRLGLSKGFSRSKDFKVPKTRSQISKGLQIDDLLKKQDTEDAAINDAWVHHLGNDLAVYTRSLWSSFDSLRACSDEVGKTYEESGSQSESKNFETLVWSNLCSFDKEGRYVTWQEGWGGIFVFVLRKLAVRLMSVAIYTIQIRQEHAPDKEDLISELCESLGVILYSDLAGSQNYGFPMRAMGEKRKRDLATTARLCFQVAADVVRVPTQEDNEDDTDNATWDLIFMIGKCDEKTANSLQNEVFPVKSDTSNKIRLYEHHMRSALEQYALAYKQAKEIEKAGGSIVELSGGSAHGSTELLYRIHATRLKCLIKAVSHRETEVNSAEEEALRLTEQHWFKAPETSVDVNSQHIRDRVWSVLGDIVDGLAQCRLDQSFFHRSVYRHAQALMWSPILYDPSCSDGSMGDVPATRSFKIRGLNNSTPAAHSAEVVMSSIFDKKRPQLCAVWLTTTTAPSPFQMLNNSNRKYDSLRGKYISAYLDTLQLCNRRSKAETFLKWAIGCRRDLPSYFQASAAVEGGVPGKSHINDPLLLTTNSLTENSFLTTTKRQANGVFASILSHEISTKLVRSGDQKKAGELFLKYAYAAYLRLNCTAEDLVKVKAWKYGRDPIREVDAVCEAFLALQDGGENVASATTGFGDWSGNAHKSAIFDEALKKCKSLFPTLSGNFFSKKASAKSKKNTENSQDDPPESPNKKRKEPEPVQEATASVSYEVVVPAELSAGESFFTTVKVGNTTKKLKLTVPEPKPSTLRFTLKVPKAPSPEPSEQKKARLDESEKREEGGSDEMATDTPELEDKSSKEG